MDPNIYLLVRVTHERRIEEALRNYRYWHRQEKRFLLPKQWQVNLGDRLIALGLRLKMQPDAEVQMEPLA